MAASSVSQTARLASLDKLTQAQGKWKNTLCLGPGKGRTPTSINDDSSFVKAIMKMVSQEKKWTNLSHLGTDNFILLVLCPNIWHLLSVSLNTS